MTNTTTIQVRRGAAATASANNPVLAAGEIGFETDTGKLKIGDGSTGWNALGYATDLSRLPSVLNQMVSAYQEGTLGGGNGGGGAGNAATLTPTSGYNVTPSAFAYFRDAMARAQTGGVNAHIMCCGDSTTIGSPGPQDFLRAWPQVLRALIAAKGNPDRGSGIISPDPLTLLANAPATSTGLNWYTAGIMQTGSYLQGGSGHTLSFTATTDQFTVWYEQRSVAGDTIGVTLDGASQPGISCVSTGANRVRSAVIAPSSQGTHTLVLTAPPSGNGFLLGVEARANGGTGSVTVSDFCRIGESSYALADSSSDGGGSSLETIGAIGADLLIIDCGVNDYIGGGSLGGIQTPAATYLANLQAAISAQRAANGDVLLIGWPPNGSSTTANGGPLNIPQSTYIQQLYSLCDANNVAMVDLHARWGSFSAAAGLPTSYYSDQSHPSAVGHHDLAQALYQTLASVGCGL